MLKVIPIGNRLLVEQHKEENKAKLLLTDDDVKRRPVGTVIEVGEGIETEITLIHKGDTIIFNELAGERVNYEGQEYLIVNLSDVLARIQK